jgi:hypoxanthine phosphoribosyltransferase|tara:strand:+ start:2433 stop:2969 length:537 start_codon:yes stop_codon:yes gene_type:complete
MGNLVELKDKTFKPFMSAAEIAQINKELAEKINTDFEDKEVLFIAILNGAFVFAADLMRNITIKNTISFVKVASYEGLSSSGTVKKIIGLMDSLANRHVIIIEDIIDTGNTLDKLLPTLKAENPASLSLCTLLFKPEAFKATFDITYIGKPIPNKFIVGYGLDYDGYGRNLSDIYQIV